MGPSPLAERLRGLQAQLACASRSKHRAIYAEEITGLCAEPGGAVWPFRKCQWAWILNQRACADKLPTCTWTEKLGL
jgi:hypothetical protein